MRPASLLEMGDDAATGLGLRVLQCAARCRLRRHAGGDLRGNGPIGFIAWPHRSWRRLSGSAGMTMIASAAMGALLLEGADFLAQRLPAFRSR